MRSRNSCLWVVLMVLCFGCTTVSREPLHAGHFDESMAFAFTTEPVSLFSSDEEVLSDEAIARILAYEYTPQKENRIAVLALGQERWFGWSDELARAGRDVQSSLLTKLLSSPMVRDASYLPTLLIPERETVGHYREAGARYQADLLLIYRASCRTYEKYSVFSHGKSKLYCNVEALLLDVRNGIVPFAVTASRDFLAEKSEEDISRAETAWRVELEALQDALSEIGDEVVAFLADAAQ
ncbi:MAG TPA: hypothetical protein HPP83_09825 [Candidatus Hydrogenedentes bacterium]|nr:hypothetical protein [Candidatus Hydrogenedentota bacterium]